MKPVRFAVALLALLIVPNAFAAGWLNSTDAAQKQARAKNKVIFVDMFAEWCGWCHEFAKTVAPSEAFQKATDNMVLLKLDTEDGKEGTKLARQFQITNLPTFLILNPDLSIVGVIRGYAPPADFANRINQSMASYRTFAQQLKNESSFATDYQKRLDLAKELRMRQAYDKSASRFLKLTSEKGVPADVRDQAYYELGVVYFLQQKYPDVQKTISSFNKVQTKGEPYERAQLLASDVCLAQGNLKCAADVLRKFKSDFPNSTMIANVDAILPNIERQLGTPRK